MKNKYNNKNKSFIIERQAQYLFSKVKDKVNTATNDEEISMLVSEFFQRYYKELGRPLLVKRNPQKGELPYLEEYNSMIEEITEDISILFGETKEIANSLVDYFNYAQSEKDRIKNRIAGISSLATDLNLVANEMTNNSIHFKDSFTDSSKIESEMIMGIPARIATKEGVATLAVTSSTNRSKESSIKQIQGDGEKGTEHIVRRVEVDNGNDQFTIKASFIAEQTPNNDPSALLDERPDTVFEYQAVGISKDDATGIAKGYDVEWASASRYNDKLRLKVVIELSSAEDINWINVNPYHPPSGTGKVKVHSIRTSEDGFDYQSLYGKEQYVLNAEINTSPQTYRAEEVFSDSNDFNKSKFAGQGVWTFPTRKAKYIEIVFDQDEAYEELMGHAYYERVTTTTDPDTQEQREVRMRIPSSQAPKNVVDGSVGKYTLSKDEYIEKGIDIFNGWRYAIGLKDINIMSYMFETKSEFVSKRYEADKTIKQVMLYANEKIPEAFLDKIQKGNDWIQYFISYDDVSWHRISPMHHEPLDRENFAPKIYEFNNVNIDAELSHQLHKEHLHTEKEVKGIRLKVVMQRPTDIEHAETLTPILEDYSLRMVFNDEHIES